MIAPLRPGVFQVKILGSLLTYPQGKSAMVHYGFAENVQKAIARFASGKLRKSPQSKKDFRVSISSLVYRHLIDDFERAERQGLDSAHASRLSLEQSQVLAADFISRFAARFGCAPSMTFDPTFDTDAHGY